MHAGGWFAVLTCLVSCKSGGSEVECGPGTVERDRQCIVAEAPPAPAATVPDAGTRAAEPSCAELCKQLVACKPLKSGRTPLLADKCAARCSDDDQRPLSTFAFPDKHPMGEPVMHAATIQRPDCSKGCDDKGCQVAWNWAAEPEQLENATAHDPVTFTVSDNWVSATNKAAGLARITFVPHCANPGKLSYPLERVYLWVERGKTAKTQILDGTGCGHTFVQIEGVLFDDQSIWRPGFYWSCASPDGTYAPCSFHKPIAAKK